ncbi:MAG: hypothetical protein IPO94_08170 [Saprospiraceae bacterium]|nr:hypothetical protein [Saprospiraceae bacterium]
MRYYFYLFVLLILGCVKPNDYSDVPSLGLRVFKNTMNQGNFSITRLSHSEFIFTDGDGDFGTASTDSDLNIFVKDLRTNQIFSQYKAPFVPLEGAGNGISGIIYIKMYTTCCIFPPESQLNPCESSLDYQQTRFHLKYTSKIELEISQMW